MRASPARPAFMIRGPVGILGCQVPDGAARGAGAARGGGGATGAGGGATGARGAGGAEPPPGLKKQ